MNTSQVMAALAVEYARFLSDLKLNPDMITNESKMMWQSGFMAGAAWATENAKERVTSLMGSAQRLGAGS